MLTKRLISGIVATVVIVGAGMIFYPEKTSQAKQSVEAAGSVAVDKIISALEERVGKTDVAYEHYKTSSASEARVAGKAQNVESGLRA